MPTPTDRIGQLEARIAELETARPTRGARRLPVGSRRILRRLALIGLALALTVPAGVVLASHRFNDVPTGHQFHADIAAIADAGITSGCPQGTNNYCPNGLVTRGQMAAFLNRLGALAPGKAPKVNADRVDGRHANQLSRIALFSTSATTPIPASGSTQYGGDLNITAPTAGFVTVSYGFTIQTSTCASLCNAWGLVRHVQSGEESNVSEVYATAAIQRAAGSLNWVFPVDPGVNTFRLILARLSSSGTMNGWFATGTALFTPFGSTGGGTLAEAELMEVQTDLAKLGQ